MSRSEPRWLGRLAIDEAHARQVREHGGPHGLRDADALEAALARPRHRWADAPEAGLADLADLAAAYAFGLVRGHPYVDGNERVGLVALAAFLDLNGTELLASDREAVDTILGLAAGAITEDALAGWVRRRIR